MNASITIKRTDGKIETVETQFSFISPVLFSEIKGATSKAGRGECLSYDNHGKQPLTINSAKFGTQRKMYAAMHTSANQEAGLCPHCGGHCDGDCRS